MMYFEKTIPRFDDKQFKAHFRLLPQTFEVLFQKVYLVEPRRNDVRVGRPNVDLEKQIYMTLWYLANTECFRSIADRFGLSKKACWTAVFYICKLILQVNFDNRIIHWPNQEEALKTAHDVELKTKFPGVIGCIDGTHISIPAPKMHPNSYINRKKFHSVLLQAVCDENMVFLDCYAGEAGSIHDSCLFRQSDLFKRISDGTLVIPEHQHMLGDQGYGLTSYLMIPYKDNGSLNESQKNFNKTLSSIRVVIERAFGLLKNRFRRLQGLQSRKPEFIPLTIMAACILHNFCLKGNDGFEFEFTAGEDFSAIAAPEGRYINAKTKRNTIALSLV